MEEDEKPFIPPAYEAEERGARWPVVAVLVGASIMVMCCMCGAGIVLGGQLA